MNAQPILEQIREDAQLAAEKIVADAQKKAAELKDASREKIEGMHAAMVSQAEKESSQLEERMLRMAELDERKELLQKKRDLMDEAFQLAKEKLKAMPADQKRAFFFGRATDAAQGGETLVIGSESGEWFDTAFVEDVSRALEKLGKAGGLTLGTEGRTGVTGVILVKGGAETHCTFETLLEAQRAQLETKVAETLFR